MSEATPEPEATEEASEATEVQPDEAGDSAAPEEAAEAPEAD